MSTGFEQCGFIPKTPGYGRCTRAKGHGGPCAHPATPGWDADDLAELRRMIPDLDAVLTHNPVTQVYFRAGLLACREYMARFVEQGGDKVTGQSIRANWWPSLGEDPGQPRKLRFDEIADEKPDGRIEHKDMSPSVEALPIASAFLNQGVRGGGE